MPKELSHTLTLFLAGGMALVITTIIVHPAILLEETQEMITTAETLVGEDRIFKIIGIEETQVPV